MPSDMCCDISNKILRLVLSVPDSQVRTTAYLALEVLYASRRLHAFGDHVETTLKQLLENPELPDVAEENTDMNNSLVKSFDDQRVVAYI